MASAVTLPLESLDAGDFEAAAERAGQSTRLSDARGYLLSTKGKLLRSGLVLEAAKFGPTADGRRVRRAAVSVELLHMASLAHDDVVDRADLRRRRPSARAKFGNLTAVFAGGSLLGRAAELVSECGDEATALMLDATARICEGEMLQAEDIFNVERQPERYFRTVSLKTAGLFGLAARLGARLAGADTGIARQLERYGHELGMAFQISDDLTDLLEPEGTSGKTSHRDIQQGLYTLPVIYALEGHADLRRLLVDGSPDERFTEVTEMIEETDAIERTIDDCLRHVEQAKRALEGLPRRGRLVQLPDSIVSRLPGQVQGQVQP